MPINFNQRSNILTVTVQLDRNLSQKVEAYYRLPMRQDVIDRGPNPESHGR